MQAEPTSLQDTHLLTHQCYWVINTAIDNLGSSSHHDTFKRLVIPDSASNSTFGFQYSHLERQLGSKQNSHTRCRTTKTVTVLNNPTLRDSVPQKQLQQVWREPGTHLDQPSFSEEWVGGLTPPLSHQVRLSDWEHSGVGGRTTARNSRPLWAT